MTTPSYFIWQDKHSYNDKKIIVSKLPPIEMPAANIEKVVIPGRDGFLTIDDGTYGEQIKPVECYLDDGDIDDICTWLTGSGFVTFSNEPDKKYYSTIINSIPLAQIIPTFHSFIVQFDCQPKKYSLTNDMITITTSPATVANPGSANSKPQIKVYGTGDIDLTINSNVIHLYNVESYVTIDSELVDAYKDTALKNNDMLGDFPQLIPGNNAFSWTGTVTKIEITPNWRWL